MWKVKLVGRDTETNIGVTLQLSVEWPDKKGKFFTFTKLKILINYKNVLTHT